MMVEPAPSITKQHRPEVTTGARPYAPPARSCANKPPFRLSYVHVYQISRRRRHVLAVRLSPQALSCPLPGMRHSCGTVEDTEIHGNTCFSEPGLTEPNEPCVS